uniref:Uncharacterized protein n=1 Tax=Rhizophora mucronata TaxID=61149 RepID=A0A2P2JNW1_RHIMU
MIHCTSSSAALSSCLEWKWPILDTTEETRLPDSISSWHCNNATVCEKLNPSGAYPSWS